MKIVKHILSFILMLCIIASVLIGIFANTLASKQYILAKLEEVDFYNGIESTIKNNIQNNIMQSGMDESVFENLFDSEKLRHDINNLIDVIYENSEIQIETDSIRTNLQNNINKYINEKNLRVTNQSELDILINTIVDIYQNTVVYSKSVITQISSTSSKVIDIIQQVQVYVYMVTAFLSVILILLNLKVKSDIARYLGIPLLASGIILVIMNVFINTQFNILSISVMGEVITNLLHNVVNQILNTIFYIGIAMIVIGILCLVIKVACVKDVKKSENPDKKQRKSKH